MSIKISVIITVYNCEKYIERCLNSVLLYRKDDLEVICIDDHSEDKSWDIIQKYHNKDYRIKCIQNEKTYGIGYARNIGLTISSGDFVWFVDADDMIVNDAIKVLLNIINNNELDIIYFHCQVSFENNQLRERYKELEYNCIEASKDNGDLSVIIDEIKKGTWYGWAWTAVYKRKFLVFHKLQFPTGVLIEDLIFSLRALTITKSVKMIDTVLYEYCKRELSLTTNPTHDVLRLYSVCSVLNGLSYIMKEGINDSFQEAIEILFVRMIRELELWFRKTETIDRKQWEKYGFERLLLEFVSHSYYGGLFPYKLKANAVRRIKASPKVIIYGSGFVAKNLIDLLTELKIEIYGVTKTLYCAKENIGKYQISPREELLRDKNDAIVLIAVRSHATQDEIICELMSLGISKANMLTYDEIKE